MFQVPPILIEAKEIACQFDGAESPLFANIDLNLSTSFQALIGRNGVGKSYLAAILAGKRQPSAGFVHHFCEVGYLAQNPVDQVGNGADVLGVSTLLATQNRILDGHGVPADFDLFEGHWDIDARLEKLLSEGELSTKVLTQSFNSLSGGERTRLQLLALKEKGCGFLILDEPSNHLDKEGRIWLVNWLKSFSGGILVVSHDPRLLDEVSIIYELTSLGIQSSRGGFGVYQETQAQLLLGAQRDVDQAKKQMQQSQISKQSDLERISKKQSAGKKDRLGANQSKLILDKAEGRSQATQSRVAKIHEERVGSAKINYQEAQEKLERLDPLAIVIAKPEVVSGTLIYMQDVILPFVNDLNNEPKKISLTINASDRIALVGRNGSGKSTLLKIMAKIVPPVSGHIRTTSSKKLMDQHFSFLDLHQSALFNFEQQSPGWREDQYRTRLAQLRLRKDQALRAVGELSGGEQLKVALACLFCGPQAPALLLLDEPDNHLDLESRTLLAQALHDYQGALVLVSHDESFIESVGVMESLSLES